MRRREERGSTLVEFTLVGIPLMFVLISTFEMARGMWIYVTLADTVKETARYAAVRGRGCTGGGNACAVTVAQVAQKIAAGGLGLMPGELDADLATAGATIHCHPLTACYENPAAWPPAADSLAGSEIAISGAYTFHSAMGMFWPGNKAVTFDAVILRAASTQLVQF